MGRKPSPTGPRWRILARHRWVSGAVITESVRTDDDLVRQFTATIRGYRNWRIARGRIGQMMRPDEVAARVCAIRDRIDAGDEGVFQEPQAW